MIPSAMRRTALSAAAVVAAVVLCGCTAPVRSTVAAHTGTTSGSPSAELDAVAAAPQANATIAAATSRAAAAALPAVVTSNPAFGATGLSPSGPLTITVANGAITAIQITNSQGNAVHGNTSADGTSWTLTEPLAFGTTYTVTGTAAGTDGIPRPITGSYTTITPVDQITTSISPDPGSVVGVAAPVIVSLGYPPADRALIESHMHITTTPHVDGAWAWIRHDGDTWPALDWRPKGYWPAGTQVHVESDIYGLDFGGGYYGGPDATSDFTIGRNQVVLANAQSYQIVIQRDGQTVATYPASFGNGDIIGDPNRVTRSGVHVVMDKQQTTTMSNPAYGYTNVVEHWAVRISDNGEFIHQNQNTVADQGNTNVSHGCINLSADNAQAYYESAIYGDPVEVTGTSMPLSAADGDIYDWTIPWNQWLTMSSNPGVTS